MPEMCKYCGEREVYVKSSGLCSACYQRLRRNGTLDRKRRFIGADEKCSFCGKGPVQSLGLCYNCYARQRRNGTPDYKRNQPREYGTEIIAALKKRYPKFSKVALCMIRNPEYGVDLSRDAKNFLKKLEEGNDNKTKTAV